MKKCLSVTLILAMLFSLAGIATVCASAAETTQRVAAYAAVTPTIDGEEDAIWSTTPEMIYERNWERNGVPAHQKAVVKMLWDADNLYILVRMEYTAIHDDNRFVELRICEDTTYGDLWSTARENGGHGISIFHDGSDSNIYQIPKILDGNYTLSVKENADGDGFVAEIRVSRIFLDAFTEGTEIRFAASTYDHDYLNTGKLNNGITYRGDGCKPTSCDTVKLVANTENPGLPQTEGKTVVVRGWQTMNGTDGKTDVRFVGEIDSLNYDAAGFELEITYNGKTAKQVYQTAKAFTCVLADGEQVMPTAAGNYLIAIALTDIPAGAVVTFTVTPYTLIGAEKTYGTAQTIALNTSNG